MCDVIGCEEEAVRSLSRKKVGEILPMETSRKRAHLCKQHYKEYKKKTRKEREIERLDWR